MTRHGTFLFVQALKLNIFVYKQNIDLNNYKATGTEKNIRSTAYVMLDLYIKNTSGSDESSMRRGIEPGVVRNDT
jgi:hypothetical protein